MLAALDAGGNPSSVHAAGRRARATLERARDAVAALTGAAAGDVVFTSGGTEALALALGGAVAGTAEGGGRISRLFVSAVEHPAVLANAAAVAKRAVGLRLETVPVTVEGTVDLEALGLCLREGNGRALVAVMAANNETGVIQPIEQVAALAKDAGALLLVDGVQAAGKIDLKTIAAAADYLALSAHKLGGPSGAGALIVREGAPFAPQILGGGQEKRRRAGTENLSGIAGFGAAASAAAGSLATEVPRLAALRDRFERGMLALLPDLVIFGAAAPRLANTCLFAWAPMKAETALMALDLEGVMVSSGAACSSGKVARSHVLEAMGVPEDLAASALRVSFGWTSREDDGDAALSAFEKLARRASARAA